MYIVIEVQGQGSSASVLHNSYVDRATAENKYHTVLAAAAASQIPIHSAVMINERGTVLKTEYYDHTEPEESISE